MWPRWALNLSPFIHMGYWLSVKSRWQDIGHVLFLRVYEPRLRCRRRRAYAPTGNTASHDNHEKINSMGFLCFPSWVWGSLRVARAPLYIHFIKHSIKLCLFTVLCILYFGANKALVVVTIQFLCLLKQQKLEKKAVSVILSAKFSNLGV